jgi:hypothetical protein
MKLLKKLQNPFLLVGQGFAMGAILFFSTQADTADSLPAVGGAPSVLAGIAAS